MESGAKALMVAVPPGLSSGMMIRVNMPANGGELNIVIPPGLTEGMPFEVDITAQAPAEGVPIVQGAVVSVLPAPVPSYGAKKPTGIPGKSVICRHHSEIAWSGNSA